MCGTALNLLREIRFYTRITSGPLTLILTSWHATSSKWNSHLEKQSSGFSILQRKFLGLTAFRLIHRSSQLLKDTLGVPAIMMASLFMVKRLPNLNSDFGYLYCTCRLQAAVQCQGKLNSCFIFF